MEKLGVIRKKLIEVSIPLEAINAASAREKSIRHGHPSTLHLWWARRPLAACRAVQIAQLVDDPSSWPDRFGTEEAQVAERKRLHDVIKRLVPWEASNDETILNEARWEIARSVAWGLGEDPPARDNGKAILNYLQNKAPPVYDPFSGGGSIPLEAQRLGLRAYGSDLNPVAVLIGKALVEIPPKFADLPPVNPKSQAEFKRGGRWNGKRAQGLAEDVRYYGQWMRDEAEKRIGCLYPKAKLADGSEATVVAWLWARTVPSPDPAAKGAMVPLVSSFMLSTKEGRKAWVEPVIDSTASQGWRFEVRAGTLSKEEEKSKAEGTKAGRAMFRCILTGANIGGAYIDEEAQTGQMSARLMAIVAEGTRSRVYLSPSTLHEAVALKAAEHIAQHGDEMNLPQQECRGTFASNAQGRRYCFKTFSDYFTPRQLVTLTTFSDLVSEVNRKVLCDASVAGMVEGDLPLHAGGVGAHAYADTIVTYLSLALDRPVMGGNSLTRWNPVGAKAQHAFGRQGLAMVWDYAETNLLGDATGSFDSGFEMAVNALAFSNATPGAIASVDAANNSFDGNPVLISTDPPYYNNVAYADLSDFFYVWLRRSLLNFWPDLFRRLTSPKDAELVATPYRHGGKLEAEKFFMKGMGEALTAIRKASIEGEPLAIYYAFKQSESADDGVTMPGWATFLQAVVEAGLSLDGTWPLRTEMATRMVSMDANALASSIVLVCRQRPRNAGATTRADFIRELKREMPEAIDDIRKAGVGPVDMQQSVIGPGMGIFTGYAKVLEDDDSTMTVKTALSLINRVWEEIENELDANFDSETQVALAWFGTYGFDARTSGELITLANAKAIPSNALFNSGVFKDMKGKAALTPRHDWWPSEIAPNDNDEEKKRKRNLTEHGTSTVWACVQKAAAILNAESGGGAAAGRFVAQMGIKADVARALAYRLFEIATKKGWAAEALVYNELAQEWPNLEELASDSGVRAAGAAQGELTL
jgi:putative DNA methylase